MPAFWSRGVDGIFPFRLSHTKQIVSFMEKVKEYVAWRYPFVNIINIRDVSEENLYEGQALHPLWLKAQKVDTQFLYYHSKGASNPFMPSVLPWRQTLNHHCITNWPRAVRALNEADVVGVCDLDNTISGNFWWSNSDYIRGLKNPLHSKEYASKEEFWPGTPSYRYAFEEWIHSGKPKYYHLLKTSIDHYNDYYFHEQNL